MQKGNIVAVYLFVLIIVMASVSACNTNTDCNEQSNGYCDILNRCHYCPTNQYYSLPYAGCIECESNSQCTAQSNGICGILKTCFYCSGTTPYYSSTSNKCVECNNNSDCTAQSNGICNILNQCKYCPSGKYYSLPYAGCIECEGNSQCTAKTGGVCGMLHTCFYCSGDTPYYFQEKCVQCLKNSDCTFKQNGYCDILKECNYCPSGKYYSSKSFQCVECDSDDQCGSGEKCNYNLCTALASVPTTPVTNSSTGGSGANVTVPSIPSTNSSTGGTGSTGSNVTIPATPSSPTTSGGSGVAPTAPTNNNANQTYALNQCQGCNANGKCLPIRYRINNQFCSAENNLTSQKDNEENCDNNFECKSNLCISEKCLSGSLIQKIINWFKTLFGIK